MKKILFVLVFLFVAPTQIHAYLDPGTGSYITQILIGVILGGLYAVKIYWKKIITYSKALVSFFKKNGKKTKSQD